MENTEKLVLTIFAGTALWMFGESFRYSAEAAAAPRVVSALTMVLVVAVVVQFRLSERADTIEDHLDLDTTARYVDLPLGSVSDSRYVPNAVSFRVFLSLLLALYALFSYVIGFAVVTPFFVVAYLRACGYSWLHVLAFVLAALGIIYAFMVYLYVPLDRGEVIDLSGLLISALTHQGVVVGVL